MRRTAIAAAAAALAGCGVTETTTVITPPPPLVIVDTPGSTPVASPGELRLTVTGQPDRTFLITGGLWRVCDRGTVTNAGAVAARDVRIVAVYVDKGVVVGRTTRDQATGNGGVLGDLAPGQSVTFHFCGITRNEPDVDTLTATVG